MTTIGEMYGRMPVDCWKSSKATPKDAADPQLIYGVELEIEHTQAEEWIVGGMHSTEDRSLRNGGWEYITSPMTFSNLYYCLQNFFNKSKVTPQNYSERCSVHVHANVNDLTLEQLTVVLLLYQTFEKLLFSFVGDDRDKNIFCVPWSETTLTYAVIEKLNKEGIGNVRNWQKYTALNLLPIQTQGTIEFRHMGGTPDLEKIMQWVNIIGCLFAYARKNELENVKKEICNLNTNSYYRMFLTKVFGIWQPLLAHPNFEIELEDGVLNMKYALMSIKSSNKKKLPDDRPDVFASIPPITINTRINPAQFYQPLTEQQIRNITAAYPDGPDFNERV